MVLLPDLYTVPYILSLPSRKAIKKVIVESSSHHFLLLKQHHKVHSTIWQYGLWSFQTGGTKLERFLSKNQHTKRKLLNFENWVNGEVSKIENHFRK